MSMNRLITMDDREKLAMGELITDVDEVRDGGLQFQNHGAAWFLCCFRVADRWFGFIWGNNEYDNLFEDYPEVIELRMEPRTIEVPVRLDGKKWNR